MQDLVINLLEMARMEMEANMAMEIIDLHQLLQETCNEFLAQAEAKSQSLRFEPANGPLKVKGDKVHLQQVARNLIGNAIKYTPDNGHVTVSTEIQDSSVAVRVADDGIGIPAEALPHLFEKFYRVQSKATKDIDGNGLGLAIVKSIVERHSGQITVESQLGKGSCFCFTMLREPTPVEK
jgi:signal transduction histidine kinase